MPKKGSADRRPGSPTGDAGVSAGVQPSESTAMVAVLILNWNSWADTLECLESVFKLDYPSFCVIVCDNGSTDGSIDRILNWASGSLDVVPERSDMSDYTRPPVRKPIVVNMIERCEIGCISPEPLAAATIALIRNGENLGFGAGNNIGLRYALEHDIDLVWVLNADTVVESHALSALVSRVQHEPSIGLCGSMLCHYDAPTLIEEAGGCAYYPLFGIARRIEKDNPVTRIDPEAIERRLGYVSGASCLVRKEFLRNIGPMTEELFLYGEEVDWALRAKGRYSLGFAPASIVYHKKGRSTGSDSFETVRSPASAFYLWRARLWVARRYHPIALPFLYLLAIANAGVAWLRKDAATARMILCGTWGEAPPLIARRDPEQQP